MLASMIERAILRAEDMEADAWPFRCGVCRKGCVAVDPVGGFMACPSCWQECASPERKAARSALKAEVRAHIAAGRGARR
jgi:hypothetical protein